jgi:hypothetical protein
MKERKEGWRAEISFIVKDLEGRREGPSTGISSQNGRRGDEGGAIRKAVGPRTPQERDMEDIGSQIGTTGAWRCLQIMYRIDETTFLNVPIPVSKP